MFYTYMITNLSKSSIYTGHTDDIIGRIYQHQTKQFGGFTAKYNCEFLIWFEIHDTREDAFLRERQIKKWKRQWKVKLIEKTNPVWKDLGTRLSIDDLHSPKYMAQATKLRYLESLNQTYETSPQPSQG